MSSHGDGGRRVAVVTHDALTPKMAGPAIRAWELARALAAEHDVRLVSTSVATVSNPSFPVTFADDDALQDVVRWCDVFVFQGWVMHRRPFIRDSAKVLVVDVYDPIHLEQLEWSRGQERRQRLRSVEGAATVLNDQLLRADFLLCASDKQRDFWLGQLGALGRINPATYDEDETLRSLIAVLPFGISDIPPVQTRPVLKGVVPGIGPDDKVILWGGGIYNWFDPLTLLRAVDRLRARQPGVRVYFMGLRHPHPEIDTMRMAVETRALSDELGLTGIHAFFNEGWVAYDDRQNFLLEADVGVSTHLDHIETALSFRTRILDYLWASLPVVATKGDSLAQLIEERGLGITVDPGDVAGLEYALFQMVDDEGFRKTCRENVAGVAPEFRWSRAVEPLLEFCRAPRRAPDLVDPDLSKRLRRRFGTESLEPYGWKHEVEIALNHLKAGGTRLLAHKAWSRLSRKWAGK